MRLFCLSMLFFVAACGAPKAVFTSQEATSIVVDGNLQDWKGDFSNLQRPNARYLVQNDENYLYIALETADVSLIRQIGAGGLRISFDGGAEFGKIALQYPLGMMNGGETANRNPSQTGGTQAPPPPMNSIQAEQFIKKLLHQSTALDIFTETTPQGKRFDRQSIGGISVVSTFNDGTFIYELKMPLKPIGAAEYGTGFSADKSLSINMQTIGIPNRPPPSSQQQQQRRNQEEPRRERGVPLALNLKVKLALR